MNKIESGDFESIEKSNIDGMSMGRVSVHSLPVAIKRRQI